MSEGVRVVNNAQIGHACGTGTSVIGTSVVFPDGVDSTLLVNGLPCEFRPIGPSTLKPRPSTAAPVGAASGIRYRAFYFTPSLQPHVPVHAPLLLEWVDRTTFVVLAAARWHVWNPRNTAYAERPVDDTAAAARRAERWEPWPYTVGQLRFVPKIDFPPESRHTLDLRRYPAQAR